MWELVICLQGCVEITGNRQNLCVSTKFDSSFDMTMMALVLKHGTSYYIMRVMQ